MIHNTPTQTNPMHKTLPLLPILLLACVPPHNTAPLDRAAPQHPANWYSQEITTCSDGLAHPIADRRNHIVGYEHSAPTCHTHYICISHITGEQIACPSGEQMIAAYDSYKQERDAQLARELDHLQQQLDALRGPLIRTTHYAHGQIQSEVPFNNGEIHGQSRHYHTNGVLKETIEWQNGIQHGDHILYNEQGQEIRRTRYINGQPAPQP